MDFRGEEHSRKPLPELDAKHEEAHQAWRAAKRACERRWKSPGGLTCFVEVDDSYGSGAFARWRVDGRSGEMTSADLAWLLEKRTTFENWRDGRLSELPPSDEWPARREERQ